MKPLAAIALLILLPCAVCAAPPDAPTAPAAAPLPTHIQNAIALRDAGRIPEAVAEFAQGGVHLAPDGIQMFYSEYATKQWSAGHLDAAVKAYRDGIQAAPSGVGAGLMHYGLAGLFYNKARYAEAIPEFRAATRSANYNNAWTWLLLGTSLRKTGQTAAARAAWEQAAVSPDSWRTHSHEAARRELKHLRIRRNP